MPDQPIEHLQEKVLAGGLLTASAGKAATVIDTFVSWLVAGAGAALALLIGNLSSIAPYLSVQTIKRAAVWFLLAAGLTVIEKYLASIVIGAAEAAAHAAEIGRRLSDEDVDVDFSIVLKEFEAATLPPMRWFVGRSFAKAQSGDFAASGRNFARCAQVQGRLSLVIAIVVMSALSLIVCGLGA